VGVGRRSGFYAGLDASVGYRWILRMKTILERPQKSSTEFGRELETRRNDPSGSLKRAESSQKSFEKNELVDVSTNGTMDVFGQPTDRDAKTRSLHVRNQVLRYGKTHVKFVLA
jgi:hypothetical protein